MTTPTYVELANPTVNLDDVHPQLVNFIGHLAMVHKVLFGTDLVVTSGKDGVHSAGSLHAQGLAVDIRTRDLTEDSVLLLIHIIAFTATTAPITYFDERQLPGASHIHIEWHGA